jgi:hypothetical protein
MDLVLGPFALFYQITMRVDPVTGSEADIPIYHRYMSRVCGRIPYLTYRVPQMTS